MSYRCERLSTSNFSDLEALFDAVYPQQWDRNLIRRKFDTRMFGLEYLGFLAYEESTGAVAAYYGVFPLPVRLGGRTFMAVQSGDTMTHPSHRGKGLFVTLAKKTYDLCRESEVDFVFGYPNKSSYSGFVKHLGWKHAQNMVGWNRLIPTLPLAKILKLLKRERSHAALTHWLLERFFVVLSPSEAANALAALPNENGVIHDARFAAYKNNCGFVLLHRTALVWVNLSSDVAIGLIGDQNAGKDAAASLRRLSVVCLLAGVNRIKSYFSPGSTMDRLLLGKGLRLNSNPYGYRIFSDAVEIRDFETVMADYDTF